MVIDVESNTCSFQTSLNWHSVNCSKDFDMNMILLIYHEKHSSVNVVCVLICNQLFRDLVSRGSHIGENNS